MKVLSDEEIIKGINDGRQGSKREGRDGVLVSASPEYMRDHKYACQAQHKDTIRQVIEILDGIEGNSKYHLLEGTGEYPYPQYKEKLVWDEAIQTIKERLE